jgi:hypothetical protein
MEINNQKFDLLIVSLVKLLQVNRLLDEWRSGETAKNQGLWLMLAETRQRKWVLPLNIR